MTKKSVWALLTFLLLATAGYFWLEHQTGRITLEVVQKHGEHLISMPLATAQGGDGPRFRLLEPNVTGLRFENVLRKQNTLPYLYNGAGVAVADYDGDDRPDVYLVSQDGPNRLFRQVAPWRFEDVTERAGVAGGDAWGTGATFVDFDGDGDLDLYVCCTESPNLLFVNQGDGTFREGARNHGLDHVGASTMAAFADYDRDGDLDCYLLTNRVFGGTPAPELKDVVLPSSVAKTVEQMAPDAHSDRALLAQIGANGIVPPHLQDHMVSLHGRGFFGGQADRLLRNHGNRFTDVSKASGIADHGMGLSATWWDYDGDGWPDLYVANDLESPDILYHNRRDGTFANVTEQALPHVAYFGMGADAGDIDNDGRLDLIVADMASTTHMKAKWLMGEMSQRGWFLANARPQQYMRNSLFWNSGVEHEGEVRFQEIAFQAGVAATDWTWAMKWGDLDCDGWLDLFVTNGVPRFDMNPDLQPKVSALWRAGKEKEALALLRDVPAFPEQNLAFRNERNLHFANVAKEWGLDLLSVSHGAAYADFDRDGDLDIVVNNQNAPASLYENRTREGHRALVKLKGEASNRFGIDAKVIVTAGGVTQTRYLTLARGYLSQDEPVLQFGLGDAVGIETLVVEWPSRARSEYSNLPIDRQFVVVEPPARPEPVVTDRHAGGHGGMQDAATGLGLAWSHRERPFDDFKRQLLLPHKLSQLGPGVAVGDVDGDGADDLFVGGAAGQGGQLFVRQGETFAPRAGPWSADAECEDLGVLFFDADGDGDLDLFVVSGGVECEPGSELLRDRLYRNDGHGGFTKTTDALPDLRDSGSCAVAADFDRDGDLDLFVGSRSVIGKFPLTPDSRLLQNDGGRFTEQTDALAPGLRQCGMVNAALWTDVDDDGWLDLLVAVSWGPVRLFRNEHGTLRESTKEAGLADARGWWNGLAGADFDGDGDVDYLVTNCGWNTKYKASQKTPQRLFAKDFDQSGTLHVVEAKYQGDTLLPVRGRSCSSTAMPFLAQKFETYEKFAKSNLSEIYGDAPLQESFQLDATTLATSWLENDGKGRFTVHALPYLAQTAPGFGIAFSGIAAGSIDVVVAQNFFSPEPETGRMDGGLGLVLRCAGKQWSVLPARDTRFVVPGDAKGLATMVNSLQLPTLVVGVNDGPLRAFVDPRDTWESTQPFVLRLRGKPGNPSAVGARVTVVAADGATRALEVHAGSGYLSQSTPAFSLALVPKEFRVRWPDGTTTTQQPGPGEARAGVELRW